MDRNRNFRQKSKFSSKIEIFVKNRTFRPKNQILVKNQWFVKSKLFEIKNFELWLEPRLINRTGWLGISDWFNESSKFSRGIAAGSRDFGGWWARWLAAKYYNFIIWSKIKIWSKLKSLVKHKNFVKNRNSVKNLNLVKNRKCWSKIKILVKNRNFSFYLQLLIVVFC